LFPGIYPNRSLAGADRPSSWRRTRRVRR